MRRLAAALTAVMVVGGAPAQAQEIGRFSEVRLGGDGVSFDVGGRSYSGELRIRAHGDGLALIEAVGIDGYLAGIREVPATWHASALDAQAVAARTYLAWTLDRGRSGAAATYGFDICATTQCQVYAGTGAGDERWVDAVSRTAGEILRFDGAPAQAMYFSTSGGRTEPIQDIFDGAGPKPYLAGAPSPEEASPLVEWTVVVPIGAFAEILRAAGYAVGEVLDVRVESRPRGEGVWHMLVESPEGQLRIPVSDVRRSFNRHGPELYAELLPATRPDGRRYPQAIMSYRFATTFVPERPPERLSSLPGDDRPVGGAVVFRGAGWGHHVGMSQYGALAMAEQGHTYAAILAHYYGGLTPEAVPGALPATVAVGLAWGEGSVVVTADGPFTMVGDGRVIDVGGGGTWIFRDLDGAVAVVSGDALLDRLFARISAASPLL